MLQLSPYIQCPACRRLNFDPDRKLARRDEPAPCCGASGEARIIWPSAETHDILEIARKRRLGTAQGRRIAIVFLATALEMLLESILWELLAAHRSSVFLSEIILDGYRGRDRRIGLFKTLSGKSISNVLKAKKLENFLADWDEIARARNDIAHGQYFYERKGRTGVLIKRVINSCLQVFAELQNHAADTHSKGKLPTTAVP